MVSCGASVIKILLGIFNLIWLILGGAVVYIGVRLVKWDQEFSGAASLANINLKTASFAILAIGVVIALIAFLGFFGACCENSFMLNAYGFLMILMIGAQIYALVYAIKNNSNIQDEIGKGITTAIQEINSKDKETRFLLETLQYNLKCCGWKNYNDYQNATAPVNPFPVPASCCGTQPDKDNPQTCLSNNANLYQDGLEAKLHFNDIENLFKGTIGVGVAVIMFELILIFAACCLAREVRY